MRLTRAVLDGTETNDEGDADHVPLLADRVGDATQRRLHEGAVLRRGLAERGESRSAIEGRRTR